jgi:hypothetical protein
VQQFAGTVGKFFIKNLENVQGDERDIILVSTVYGPGKDGNVRQNFGLMSREVGWRRLSVLVTRAKLSTRVFTSLRPEDIKVTDTSSKGRARSGYDLCPGRSRGRQRCRRHSRQRFRGFRGRASGGSRL